MRLAVVAILSAISIAAGPATQPTTQSAASKKRAPGTERTVHAMVAGVEGQVLKVSILKKKAQLNKRRIRVNKATVITLNSQTVTLASLKAGENVTIKLNHGVATHIDATGK